MSSAGAIARSDGINMTDSVFHAIFRVNHLRTLETLSQ